MSKQSQLYILQCAVELCTDRWCVNLRGLFKIKICPLTHKMLIFFLLGNQNSGGFIVTSSVASITPRRKAITERVLAEILIKSLVNEQQVGVTVRVARYFCYFGNAAGSRGGSNSFEISGAQSFRIKFKFPPNSAASFDIDCARFVQAGCLFASPPAKAY